MNGRSSDFKKSITTSQHISNSRQVVGGEEDGCWSELEKGIQSK